MEFVRRMETRALSGARERRARFSWMENLMKRPFDPCENHWNVRDHVKTALPDPLREDAILSASRSAFRRCTLLSSVSLLALATLTAVPFEFDTQTLTPTVSVAQAGEGGQRRA